MSCTFLVCVSPFRRLLFFSPISNCQFQDLPPKRPRRTPFSGCSSRQNSRETPPLWARQTPLFGFLTSAYTLLHGFLSPTPVKTRPPPPRLSPLSTPEPGSLHLEDFLLLMFSFLDTRLRSEDVAFNRTLTTPTPQRQIRVGREIPQFPTRRVFPLSTLPDTM